MSKKPEEQFTFDKDGYPTEETLERLAKWPIQSREDCRNLLDLLKPIWRYSDCGYFEVKEDGLYVLSTGGWSGNESIIYALEQNHIFWTLAWFSSRRGGRYQFDPTWNKSGKYNAQEEL